MRSDGAVLRWDGSAADAERLVGSHARLLLDDGMLIVRGATAGDRPSFVEHGTVVRCDDELVVATQTNDLHLTGLVDPAGRPVRPGELSLAPGDRLPVPGPEELAALERWARDCAPHEAYWAARLVDLRPARPGFAMCSARPVPAERGPLREAPDPLLVVAALARYLRPANGGSPVDVAYAPRRLRAGLAGAARVFADALPLRLSVRPEATGRSLLAGLRRALDVLSGRSSYPRDVVAWLGGGVPELPLGLATVADGTAAEEAGLVPGTAVSLTLGEADGCWCLWYDPSRVAARDAGPMATHLARLVDELAANPERPLLPAPVTRRIVLPGQTVLPVGTTYGKRG
jgi:hypothetical protein